MRDKNTKSVAAPLALAGLGAAVLALTVGGVSAVLNAQTQNLQAQPVTTGTLSITMSNNGAGFSQNITNLAPGDVANRYVSLENDGTLEGQNLTLLVNGSGSQALVADGATTRALQLSVTSCSQLWDAASGVCAGTTSSLLTNATLSTLSNAVTLENTAFDAGQTRHLQLALSLPDQNETTTNGVAPTQTVQGQEVSLTYTFGFTQRTASTSSE